MLSLLLGLAHGASDGAAGMLVMQVIMLNGAPEGGLLVLLYNGLAFGMQPLAGLLLDRLGQPRRGAVIGLVLTAAGVAVTWLDPRWGMMLAGCGSALLHAGGGSVAISATPGRAAAPGLFAAFGVVGLAIGSQLAFYFSVSTTIIFVLVLLILAACIWVWKNPQISQGLDAVELPTILKSTEWTLIAILIAAVGLRSLVWTGVDSVVAGYSQTALWLALAAGTGKLLGGFAADKVGWQRYAPGALILTIILLSLGNNWFVATILGVFFLQSVTPLSLAVLGKWMPKTPALAASLVLGTGIILGGLPFMLLPGGWFGPGIMIAALLPAAAAYGWVLRKK